MLQTEATTDLRQFSRIDTAGNDLTRDVFRIQQAQKYFLQTHFCSRLAYNAGHVHQHSSADNRYPVRTMQPSAHRPVHQPERDNHFPSGLRLYGDGCCVGNFYDIRNPAAESWSLLTGQ